jgi:signal transduction histidine kinase
MLSRLVVVNEVSAAALRHPAAEEIYRVVAESIWRSFSYLVASVFEVRPADREVVLVAQAPPRELSTPPYRQPLDAGLVGVAIRERSSVLVNDVARDPRYVRPPAAPPGGLSELCVPVLRDGEVAAVLDVECRAPNAFGESDRLALESIANVVGLALHAAETHAALERQIEALRDAQCQLLDSERLADVGRLTSQVAHEIRNPLTTIGGFARRIAEKGQGDERTLRYASIIVEEVERLERLLAGVMDFVRPGPPQKAPTDINALVARALAACEGELQGKHIAIEKHLHPDLPEALVDPDQIEQVFVNILKNAFDSIPDRGTVTVLTERAADSLVIRVSDTGMGIAPDDLANVFDPFYTTKPGGTGLGLAVASKIVDDHGGRILIGSEAGKGTHVNIRLPLGLPSQSVSQA